MGIYTEMREGFVSLVKGQYGSIAAAAKELGINQSTLNSFLRPPNAKDKGGRRVNFKTAETLLDHFGCKIVWPHTGRGYHLTAKNFRQVDIVEVASLVPTKGRDTRGTSDHYGAMPVPANHPAITGRKDLVAVQAVGNYLHITSTGDAVLVIDREDHGVEQGGYFMIDDPELGVTPWRVRVQQAGDGPYLVYCGDDGQRFPRSVPMDTGADRVLGRIVYWMGGFITSV